MDRIFTRGAHGPRTLRCGLSCLLILTLHGAAHGLHAQTFTTPPDEARWTAATWVDDFNFLAANSLLNGIVAGVFSAIRSDGSFADGFVKGASGGALVYTGKRLAAERFFGAGLLGREVAAVGTSITRSVRTGSTPLGELVLPIGPLRFYWKRDEGDLEVRPDISALYWLGYGVVESRLELDWRKSLSAGAAVFVTRGAALKEHAGQEIGSMILLSGGSEALDDVLAHERIHVIQQDNQWGVVGEPLEDWAVGHLGPVSSWLSHVDLGPTAGLSFFVADVLWDRPGNPFEVEGDFLEVRSGKR